MLLPLSLLCAIVEGGKREMKRSGERLPQIVGLTDGMSQRSASGTELHVGIVIDMALCYGGFSTDIDAVAVKLIYGKFS